MNYVEAINKEVLLGNWIEVSRLALLANGEKYHGENTSFFGIRKGYINCFKGGAHILNELENNDIKVFNFPNQPELGKALKSKEITTEIVDNKFVILCYDKDTVLGRLTRSEYKLLNFSIRSSSAKAFFENGSGGYIVRNIETGEQTAFENINQLVAIEREKRIDRILKD
jgi:hypothetical protein